MCALRQIWLSQSESTLTFPGQMATIWDLVINENKMHHGRENYISSQRFVSSSVVFALTLVAKSSICHIGQLETFTCAIQKFIHAANIQDRANIHMQTNINQKAAKYDSL